MKNRIWQIVLIVSLALAVVSGINVFKLSREYQEGINTYASLEQYVSIEEEPETEVAEKQEQTGEEETVQSVIPISLDVQYEELKEINSDFTGWLYYEPLEISYPITRGNDNEYYTEYTFENVKNSSGGIFMDFLNRKDYSDYNTIIYGHNMRNGTMFGSLKKLLNDESIITENPYFYIFTEDKAYMYEIFAVYITTADSATYDLVNSEEDQSDYLAYIQQTAAYLSDKEVTASDRIVTLSTCHGLHSNNRTVVHGVLIAEEDR
jgi:sortase B